MGCRRALLTAALLFSFVRAPAARAQYARFENPTDTIDVAGQTVIGMAATYEAVILFPSGSGAAGFVFNEWTDFAEDKQLTAGPDVVGGFDYSSPCCLQATSLAIAPDVFHHIAFVYDGTGGEERIYLDGSLVASRAASAFDVSDADGTAHIGAIFRDGIVQSSFIGTLDSLRVSDVARYSGTSFTPPTGDMTSDADTLLLYNFDEPQGSPTVADGGPLARTGTLGQGFGGATSPQLSAAPEAPSLDSFLCYKARSTKGSLCSADSPQNAGNACRAEEDCGGNASTALCVPNKLPKGVQVTLADPLGESSRTVDVKKGAVLCNPADVNGAGIQDEVDHLRGYGIALAKGQPAFPAGPAVVTNDFGTVSLATGKVDRLLIPAAKGIEGPVSPPDPPGIDHFRCAKVKVAKGAPRFEKVSGVPVVDQFGDPKLYDLKKPAHLCTPVNKNGEGILDPLSLLLCYQAKQGRGQAKPVKHTGLHVAHQLALELVDALKVQELCVPSSPTD
jgi:hypothetical protein